MNNFEARVFTVCTFGSECAPNGSMRAVIVPDWPGTTADSSRNFSSPGANSSSSGMRATVKVAPGARSSRATVVGAA